MRLAERGVRFIQLYHKDWDHHGEVKEGSHSRAQEVDRACAGLILDLEQRGMLEDTLVVWAGEFGRTPMSQGGVDVTTITRVSRSGSQAVGSSRASASGEPTISGTPPWKTS